MRPRPGASTGFLWLILSDTLDAGLLDDVATLRSCGSPAPTVVITDGPHLWGDCGRTAAAIGAPVLNVVEHATYEDAIRALALSSFAPSLGFCAENVLEIARGPAIGSIFSLPLEEGSELLQVSLNVARSVLSYISTDNLESAARHQTGLSERVPSAADFVSCLVIDEGPLRTPAATFVPLGTPRAPWGGR